MADYFSDYNNFVGGKRLPSPADTPYETPNFIRSKRSSRATASSSREQSASPPPLPPSTNEYQDGPKDGKFGTLDPRRFTPTLHASLVSEILNLRRELDSKNNLVENLETSLSTARTENEALNVQISQYVKDVRKAKQQVQQMEKGTYEVVETLVKERDQAVQKAEDFSAKLDDEKKKTRRQDEDAVRTQGIWENEKESWENERRQLERRIHVTENRLRGFVEEMTAQQLAAMDAQTDPGDEVGEEGTFKDSGIGNESDTTSIKSASPRKHRRNISSVSTIHRSRSVRSIRFSAAMRGSTIGTPEPGARPMGHSLADELGIDEGDEYDMDGFEQHDEDFECPSPKTRTAEIGLGVNRGDDSQAQRLSDLGREAAELHTTESMQTLHDATSKQSLASSTATVSEPSRDSVVEPPVTASIATETPKVHYVDTGYQPSPPPSPIFKGTSTASPVVPSIIEPSASDGKDETSETAHKHAQDGATRIASSPISPPDTPVVGNDTWPEHSNVVSPKASYSDAEAQTDFPEAAQSKSSHTSKRDSLSPPSFVPSIAIHPPTSRPSSPRPYVLPPGTKNAFTQVNMPWPGQDASVQTEEIRVDTRLRKLAPHLQPSLLNQQQQRGAPAPAAHAPSSVAAPPPRMKQNFSHPLLPSPTLPEPPKRRRAANGGSATISTSAPPVPALPSPSLNSPVDSSPEMTRDAQSKKSTGKAPLRAINLPKPVLAPAHGQSDSNDGPLNRSSQYGVTRPLQSFSQLLDIDRDSDGSDYEDPISDIDPKDLTASIPSITKAPQGRFGLSEPPKMVPEDKEISPDRNRPGTSDSFGAAPAPSVASSRTNSQRAATRPPVKLASYKDNIWSRSPSSGSMASSSHSTEPTALPPFPIPRRSSSRYPPKTLSEGSQSPTGRGSSRSAQAQATRNANLRKVQSAAVIRHTRTRMSPTKSRRRRHSPNLTPVQSMAFDTAAQTDFPIPELPMPLQEHKSFDLVKGSMDIGNSRPPTSAISEPRSSTETSLVDAIAATMVGEWMWKYIRKRKSFGIGEDTSEFPAETGPVSISAHGTRHKRWVWLSPYERTIMWDNKQPTSGPALLGKKGRKLAIQSVLEVQDDTPMPKGAELESAFNRSILILTPQRALKFTAINENRHIMWMTALEFLAQAGRLPAQLPQAPSRSPPPIPMGERRAAGRGRSPSFGRSTIRDSVRLAKGRRPDWHPRNEQSAGGTVTDGSDAGLPQDADTGADFPAVPRLYISTVKHQRKRSNTAPRLPPPLSNFRSFSSSAITSSTAGRLHPGSTASVMTDPRSSTSNKSWSQAGSGSIASPDRPNFFEAVGTVRMEAFVDPNVRDGVLYLPAPPTTNGLTGPPRRRRGDSSLSVSTTDKRRAGYVFDDNGVDPFKGF